MLVIAFLLCRQYLEIYSPFTNPVCMMWIQNQSLVLFVWKKMENLKTELNLLWSVSHTMMLLSVGLVIQPHSFATGGYVIMHMLIGLGRQTHPWYLSNCGHVVCWFILSDYAEESICINIGCGALHQSHEGIQQKETPGTFVDLFWCWGTKKASCSIDTKVWGRYPWF